MADNFEDLDIFIKGETIDLCVPTLDFTRSSIWYNWFNEPKITRYLNQGLLPNTKEMQEHWFKSQTKDRLILILSTKNKVYKGVVSLSSIDLKKNMLN